MIGSAPSSLSDLAFRPGVRTENRGQRTASDGLALLYARSSVRLEDRKALFGRRKSSLSDSAFRPGVRTENRGQRTASDGLALLYARSSVRLEDREALSGRRKCFDPPQQAGRSTNIRFRFQAMVTRLHSPRTWSIPRSRNWRNPIADLIMPNTGSGICLRNP